MLVSMVSLAMLLIGFAALLLAYEVLGGPKASGDRRRILFAHRVLGYVFAGTYFFLLAGMSLRFASSEAFSAKEAVHAAMALAVAVLLLLKILIVRRFGKFTANFFAVGTAIFVMSFALVMLTAGGEIGERIAGAPAPEVRVAEEIDREAVAGLPSRLLPVEERFVTLCGQCHPIRNAIYALHEKKTVDEWTKTVDRMRARTDTISKEDAGKIAQYLAQMAVY